MPLPMTLNSRAGRDMEEVVSPMLYEVTFITPEGVLGSELLSEHVISVAGIQPIKGPEAVQQQFNTARRNYASDDVDNTQEFSITLNLNLNDNNQNYVYKTMQQWAMKIFNPFTGERGLKKDYVGTIIVTRTNRVGDVYWTKTVKQAWISGGLPALDEDITSGDPQELEVNFIADYVQQEEK